MALLFVTERERVEKKINGLKRKTMNKLKLQDYEDDVKSFKIKLDGKRKTNGVFHMWGKRPRS